MRLDILATYVAQRNLITAPGAVSTYNKLKQRQQKINPKHKKEFQNAHGKF